MTDDLPGYQIEALDAEGVRAAAVDLAATLIDCVEGGASVSFMSGLAESQAIAFWRDVADQGERDGRAVFVARRANDRAAIGVVQLIPAVAENQPHRAEVAKMLVRRADRRRGLGAALMRAAEAAAARAGKTLLTLDTASGDAERLYASLGWVRVGQIPAYALLPDGRPCATTIFFRSLAPERGPEAPDVRR